MPANTLSIANALATIITGLHIGGNPAYKTVQIGAIRDVTDALPCCEITGVSDETERGSMDVVGAAILVMDQQVFNLTTTVDEANAVGAETTAFALRDVLTETFHDATALGGTAGVIGVWLNHGSKGKYAYSFRNGIWYRTHQIPLTVLYNYTTVLVP